MIIYGVLFVVDALVVYYIIASGARGFAFVTLSIVGVVGSLLAYQTLQHYRDLAAPLAESTGVVVRKWSRADLIIAMHSYYLTVDRTVFRVKPEDFIKVDQGMYVKIVHFPYTLNVVSIHEMKRPADVPPPEA